MRITILVRTGNETDLMGMLAPDAVTPGWLTAALHDPRTTPGPIAPR